MHNIAEFEKDTAVIQPNAASSERVLACTVPPNVSLRTRIALVFSFPAVLVSVMAVTIFSFARHGLPDPDIWWHLRNAEYLIIHHRMIRADLYSFTVGGKPWINPEYLAEIPYYFAWRALGERGVLGLMLLVLGAIFFGLVYLCWRQSRNIKASVIACLFAILLCTVSFGPRTVLFGYADLVLLLIILERFRSQGRGSLWLIPPLFCLWINTHGSWSLGLVVFGMVIAGGLVNGRWGKIEATRWTPSQLRKLLATFCASIAALFVNPYGYHLTMFPYNVAFRLKLNDSHVEEWASVDFHSARGRIVLLLVVTLVLVALLSGYRWQLYELGLVLFGLYSGLTYVRFLFLLGILAAPVLAKVLADYVPPYRREIDKPVLNALLMAAGLAFIIRGFPSAVQLHQSVAAQYPAEIVPYLKLHPPSGRVLNSYNWGGYLCWKDRDFREFIDSRADIFEYHGVFKDYVELVGLQNVQPILDSYAIKYILFPKRDPLARFLVHDPTWKVIFQGKLSVMFERVGPPPERVFEPPSASKSELAW